MKEFVTANGRTFTCMDVTTGLNFITMTMEGQDIAELEAFFRDVSGLTVAMEGQGPHGVYEKPDRPLEFESITKYADGSVSVTMHIKDKTEMELDALKERLDAVEEGQELQDGAIREIGEIVGGE